MSGVGSTLAGVKCLGFTCIDNREDLVFVPSPHYLAKSVRDFTIYLCICVINVFILSNNGPMLPSASPMLIGRFDF